MTADQQSIEDSKVWDIRLFRKVQDSVKSSSQQADACIQAAGERAQAAKNMNGSMTRILPETCVGCAASSYCEILDSSVCEGYIETGNEDGNLSNTRPSNALKRAVLTLRRKNKK